MEREITQSETTGRKFGRHTVVLKYRLEARAPSENGYVDIYTRFF